MEIDLSIWHLIVLGLLALGAAYLLIWYWKKLGKRREMLTPTLYLDALKNLLSGEESLAYQKLKMVVAGDSGNVDAYLRLGDILRHKKQLERAIQIHRDLLLRPNLTEAEKGLILKSLAADYLEAGDWERAIHTLEELSGLDGYDAWSAEKLASAYERKKNWEEAKKAYAKYLKLKNEKDTSYLAKFHLLAGRDFADKKEYHKARLEYKEALNFDEKLDIPYLYIADSYQIERRIEDAIEFWKKFLAASPQLGFLVYPKLERAYFELGKFGEITEVYSEVLQKDPKNSYALLGLARILEKRGRANQAMEQYSSILENDPAFASARQALARLLLEQKRPSEALRETEFLLEHLAVMREHFYCSRCGWTSSEYYFLCGSCDAFRSARLETAVKTSPAPPD
ncbi:MAG TPA: tetratricopeptide repeat protein [candidate division Zixibacteria bacterium]|nr:tetratricopeptide repeat protein [candidate division Zixibacteria bacterium]